MAADASVRARCGRLAPSPSGDLHLGNALAFYECWRRARAGGARLVLRFEDVDGARSRREHEESQRRDLRWLGVDWDCEVRRQSERDYRPAIAALERAGAVYRCACSRRQVRAAATPEGAYAGTCRGAGHTEGAVRFRLPPGTRGVVDERYGRREVVTAACGDPVLRRRDGGFSYTLAVVADDIADGVTEVVRGADLLERSAVQEALWEALGAGARLPTWAHVPVVLGPDGRKLSKSHGSLHLAAMRDAGWTRGQVVAVLGEWLRRVPRGPVVALLPADGSPPPPGALRWTTAQELLGAGVADACIAEGGPNVMERVGALVEAEISRRQAAGQPV